MSTINSQVQELQSQCEYLGDRMDTLITNLEKSDVRIDILSTQILKLEKQNEEV